jgi:hypothetical protein
MVPRLRRLHTSETVKLIIEQAPNLESIGLDGLSWLTDDYLEQIV